MLCSYVKSILPGFSTKLAVPAFLPGVERPRFLCRVRSATPFSLFAMAAAELPVRPFTVFFYGVSVLSDCGGAALNET